ncbi:MAG: cadherin-like beta sandwich domain-containing protein [Gammaproteobacteria bacterium]|nr:cadherin-like beta sandwich domain-containing protein [Gammaproteobacteria bacterium]
MKLTILSLTKFLVLIIVLCQAAIAQTTFPKPCSANNIDKDNDGLIEICSLEMLNAIRYQLDGSGYNTSNSTKTKITAGCPADGCKGYELAGLLNFASLRSYEDRNNKDTWFDKGAWQPIGSVDTDQSDVQTLNGFSGIFEGNGYTISNLRINMKNINTDNNAGWGLSGVGLFGVTAKNAVIRNVGLLKLRITKSNSPRARPDSTDNPPTYYLKGVGGLVGINDGTIINSYVAGRIDGGTYNSRYAENNREGRRNVGSLVGTNLRKIINSYSIADVVGRSTVGGLVGENCHRLYAGCANSVGEIVNSYARGTVASEFGSGGLVGANRYKITDSYALADIEHRERTDIEDADYIAGGLVGENVNNINKPRTVSRFPQITASYWQKNGSPLPDIGKVGLVPLSYTAGLSASDLKSPTDTTDVYSTWQANDWDFGAPNQYPILRYATGKETNTCSENPIGRIDPPRCGSFLPDQGSGLRDLNISRDAIWQPTFSPDITEYTISVDNKSTESLNLQLKSYDANTEITIGDAVALGSTETTIALSADTTKLDIQVGNIVYSLTVLKVPIAVSEIKIKPAEHIKINADGMAEVDEGDEVALTVDSLGDYRYMWAQRVQNPDDVVEFISGQDTSTLSARIPTDFIKDSEASTGSVTFTLMVQGDSADSRTLSKTLIVRKKSNGISELTPMVTPKRISISATRDADGNGTFTYTWQFLSLSTRQWQDIPEATTHTYWVPRNIKGGLFYRVTVKHKDSQGYDNDYPTFGPFRADIDVDDDGLIEIYYLDQLDAMRYQLDGSAYNPTRSAETKITRGCASDGCNGYELARDLDFTDDASYLSLDRKTLWITNEEWQPIGNSSVVDFSSTFEGNGFTISNLTINLPNSLNIGLFGYAGNSAEFSNIRLLNVDVRGRDDVGGLVGYSSASKIDNIFVTGTVRGGLRVGGLIGSSLNGKITNSFVNATVRGTTRVGGLIGDSSTDKIINISADGQVKGAGMVGGLIGENGGSIIRNSFASSTVEGDKGLRDGEGAKWVGGLVGYMFAVGNNTVIVNSYASGGCVRGAKEVGGLVGSSIRGFIRNSYATSCVEYNAGPSAPVFPIGTNKPLLGGGIVAQRIVTGGFFIPTVTDSYWRTEVTGSNQLQYQVLYDVRLSGRPFPENFSSRTEDELKAPTAATGIYSKWNSNNWDFGDEENYPLVRYTAGADKDACNVDPNTAAETTLPQCGDLLPNQHDSGLGILFLSAGDTVLNENLMFDEKPFSSLVLEYEYSKNPSISDFQLIPFAINGDEATISITKQGDDKDYFGNDRRSGQASETIPLDNVETFLTISVTEKDDTATDYTLHVLDKEALVISQNFRVEPMNEDGTVNEGSRVSIIPNVIGGDEPYSHEWTHTLESEHASRVSGLNDSTLTFDISESFVDTDMNRDIHEVLFNIKVTDNVGSTTNRDVVLRVRRIDNGNPDIETEISTTTFTVIVRDDPDGNGDDDFSYQWQERILGTPGWTNTDTTADTPNTYALPPNTPGSNRYRVLITHTDAQNHTTTTLVGPFRTNIDEDGDGLIEIYYLEDLDAMRYQSDGSGYNTSGSSETKITLGCGDDGCNGYELARDLDFQEQEHYTDIENMNEWQANVGWQPIIFGSIFEGNDYTISKLFINTTDISSIHSALFSRINEGGEIRNIGLTDIDIRGFSRIGGLAAINAGLIINSYVTGTIAGTGTITGHSQIGGLVGDNQQAGRIINSHADVDIIASGDTEESQTPGAVYIGGIGGLVGINQGKINGSYAEGNVNGETLADVGGLVGLNEASIANSFATGDLSGNRNVGGLIGTIEATTTLIVISNSFATGNVYGSGDDNRNIGGLVGNSQGNVSITNTYANGRVSGSSNSGGLIGLISLAEGEVGTIINNYTTSLVTGTSNAGGLIGTHQGNTVFITASYWQNDASALSDVASAEDVRYTTSFPPGQSAEALKMPTTATGIYSGWSTADWNFGSDNEYPILGYGAGPGDDPTCDTDTTTTELPDCDRELGGQHATLLALSIEEIKSDSDDADYSEITLMPMFQTEILDYTAELKRSTDLIRINPTTSNSSSTVSYKIGADTEVFQGLANGTSFTHMLTAEELAAEKIDLVLKLNLPPRFNLRENIYTIKLNREELRTFGIRTKLFLEGPFRDPFAFPQ